jgi:hypothetical protein
VIGFMEFISYTTRIITHYLYMASYCLHNYYDMIPKNSSPQVVFPADYYFSDRFSPSLAGKGR